MTNRDVLVQLSFGGRVAEEEAVELSRYFVQTDQWKRVFEGQVDVVLGPKGSGKSAIYQSILDRRQTLELDGIRLIEAQNPFDDAAFRKFAPESDAEFRNVWKLYFLCLLARSFERAGIENRQARAVRSALEELKLIPTRKSRMVVRWLIALPRLIERVLNADALEGGVKFNEVTGGLEGITAKIVLEETSKLEGNSFISVDSLVELADSAFSQAGIKPWILLDRLDAAFPPERLEKPALRGLFRVYVDTIRLKAIRFKIFLRNDIWEHVADKEPLREASHITRQTTLSWTGNDLLNLIINRALNNPRIVERYGVVPEDVKLDLRKQLSLFYDIFPGSIRSIPTFDWILLHTADATGTAMPREVIHLLNEARNREMRMVEIGSARPGRSELFDPGAIEDALEDISEDRFRKTLCLEFPDLQMYMERLRGGRKSYTAAELVSIWSLENTEAAKIANSLVEIGFFSQNDANGVAIFTIPLLYCAALGVQEGQAS
jgi:hypothetical protein